MDVLFNLEWHQENDSFIKKMCWNKKKNSYLNMKKSNPSKKQLLEWIHANMGSYGSDEETLKKFKELESQYESERKEHERLIEKIIDGNKLTYTCDILRIKEYLEKYGEYKRHIKAIQRLERTEEDEKDLLTTKRKLNVTRKLLQKKFEDLYEFEEKIRQGLYDGLTIISDKDYEDMDEYEEYNEEKIDEDE